MNSSERRAPLNERMDKLSDVGKNCARCTGLCCTSLKNSMQTTQVETYDLYHYLKESHRLDSELIAKLKQCVSDYRLDKSFGDGRRTIRKTYTCPFYTPGPTGCSIPREVKPYGCLAFNPTKANVAAGEGCESDQNLLMEREEKMGRDEQVNPKLWWEKLPMPLALLEVIQIQGDQV